MKCDDNIFTQLYNELMMKVDVYRPGLFILYRSYLTLQNYILRLKVVKLKMHVSLSCIK